MLVKVINDSIRAFVSLAEQNQIPLLVRSPGEDKVLAPS